MANPPGSIRFRALFESALQTYEKKVGVKLAEHPLAIQLQSCDTVESITVVLQRQAQAFSGLRGDRIMISIENTVSILTRVSATASLAVDIGLVRQRALTACYTALTDISQPFPPVKVIHVCLAILLAVCAILPYIYRYPCDIQTKQAAEDVIASYDALLDLFESIELFLSRLDIYTRIPPAPATDEMIAKIMVELISTLALATRELQQGRSSESFLASVSHH
jgi:hypothetical protein